MPPLEVVEADHLGPVLSHLPQVQALTDVDQVKDILLKTGPTKPNTGLKQIYETKDKKTETGDTFKNFGPILESLPIASATSDTSAPVASQTEIKGKDGHGKSTVC